MTAEYADAVRKHRFDLLYVQGTLAALIETVPEADHLLVEQCGGIAGVPRTWLWSKADGPRRTSCWVNWIQRN